MLFTIKHLIACCSRLSRQKRTLLRPLFPAFRFSFPAFTYNGKKILFVPRIIIELKAGYAIGNLLSHYKNKLSLEDNIARQEYLLKVNTHSSLDVLSIVNDISENNKQVKWCEPDFYNSFHKAQDPLYDLQYYLNNTGQNGGTPGIDIDVPDAWAITLGSNTIWVAVIDEGVENHENFNGWVLPGYTAGNPNGNGGLLERF